MPSISTFLEAHVHSENQAKMLRIRLIVVLGICHNVSHNLSNAVLNLIDPKNIRNYIRHMFSELCSERRLLNAYIRLKFCLQEKALGITLKITILAFGNVIPQFMNHF